MTVVRINNAYAWRYVCIVLSSFLHSCKIDVCQHFQFILDFVVVVDTVGQQHKKKKKKKKVYELLLFAALHSLLPYSFVTERSMLQDCIDLRII